MRVLFLLSEYSLHNHLISSYAQARPNDQLAIVKVPLVVKGKGRVDSAKKILPKLSRRFIVAKLWEFLIVLVVTVVPKILGRGAVFSRLKKIAQQLNLPFVISRNVMDSDTLEFISDFKPDLVVSLFHQVIKPQLIAIPTIGVINLHPGLLPEFRGIQPYFWELAQSHGRAGATIHWIENAEIDSGGVLARASFPTWSSMSVQLNYYLTSLCLAEILPQSVTLLEQSASSAVAQDSLGCGEYYGWPDSDSVSRLVELGHPIFSFGDLLGILTGKYDDFSAEEKQFWQK